MVTLAQLAERGVVVLDVMGSSPICHPHHYKAVLREQKKDCYVGNPFLFGISAYTKPGKKSVLIWSRLIPKSLSISCTEVTIALGSET